MRILHLVSYSLYSGPVPSTLGLALAQRQLGHTVFLAFDGKRGAFNDFEEAAAPRLRPYQLTPPLPFVLSAKSSLAEMWRDRRALRALLGEATIDVVHCHLSHDHLLALTAGSMRRSTLIRTFHAGRSLERRLGQSFVNRRAHGYIVRNAAHGRALSERFDIEPRRVAVIPSGVDAQAFVPQSAERRVAARQRFGIPQNARLVGHVALIAGRGQEELALAVQRIDRDDLHLLYVGRGEHEATLRSLCERPGLAGRVHFAGYLEGEALLDAYAALDLAFLAQPGNDASARAVLEAMACGRPVLVVDHDALSDMVGEGRGYLAAAREPEAIASALRQWLGEADGGEQRGALGRRWVEASRGFIGEARATFDLYQRAGASVLDSETQASTGEADHG